MNIRKLASSLVQYFFVLLLTASAGGKLANMGGFSDVVATYDVFAPLLVPGVAWGLALFELMLAVWLLTSRQLKVAAKCLVILHCLYLAWLVVALFRGLDIPNCGCFGVYFPRPLTVFTLLEDLVLLGLSVWLLRSAR